VLVCLLDEQEQRPRYDVSELSAAGWTRHSVPILDWAAPSIDQLRWFVESTRTVAPDAKVLVHCLGGLGRTGTMAAAYWIARGLGAADAIARVRAARPGAIESPEQRKILEEFAKLGAA